MSAGVGMGFSLFMTAQWLWGTPSLSNRYWGLVTQC